MSNHEDKLAELNRLCDEQDANHEARMDAITADTADADRLLLLDRIAERMPDLDLSSHEVEWRRLDDGNEALVIDGGGFTPDSCGYFIANSPAENDDDLHVVGPTEPLFPGKIAAVSIHADGTRELVRLIPDPLDGWRGGDEDVVDD